jgi:demethylmenaquinone methyltransferase/2-methoxy-6-polyprenyl-1,4-benzoquinol methylase
MNQDQAASNEASGIRPHKDLPQFYSSRDQRPEFVQRLFDDTARYYDRISGALSFGTCKAYRKLALRRAGLTPDMHLLDVATGTGLAAQAALDLGLPPSHVVGLDPSAGMLHENQKLRSIPLVQARGESLPFPDGSFDFISMGYALRHVEDLALLFREFHRVLKPGGRVLILEITRPESRLVFSMGQFYLDRFLPAVTRLLTRNDDAGRLLKFYWATIAECVPPATITDALAASGLTEVNRRKTGSLLSDYSALKPAFAHATVPNEVPIAGPRLATP